MADDILKLIDKAVEEKTFSLDALTAIQTIKETARLLQEQVDRLTQSNTSTSNLVQQLKDVIAARDAEIALLKGREFAIEAREKNMSSLERSSAVATAKHEAYADIVTKMFANRTMRENVIEQGQHSFPPSGMATYPTTAPITGSKTKTTEEL